MRIFMILILATFGLVASGCSPPEPATNVSSTPVNAVCPIMGGKVHPDGGTANWNGTTVAFCCEGCAPKWDKLSNEEKAAKLASTTEPDQGHDHSGHDHSGHDHSAHEHEG